MKVCPLLVQVDTNPSYTIDGQSHTRTWFAKCLGIKCGGYANGFCNRFDTYVLEKSDTNMEVKE